MRANLNNVFARIYFVYDLIFNSYICESIEHANRVYIVYMATWCFLKLEVNIEIRLRADSFFKISTHITLKGYCFNCCLYGKIWINFQFICTQLIEAIIHKYINKLTLRIMTRCSRHTPQHPRKPPIIAKRPAINST